MLNWFLLAGCCRSFCPRFLQEFGASHTGWIPQTCLSPRMLCCCCWRCGWRDQLSSWFPHLMSLLPSLLPSSPAHLLISLFIQRIQENPPREIHFYFFLSKYDAVIVLFSSHFPDTYKKRLRNHPEQFPDRDLFKNQVDLWEKTTNSLFCAQLKEASDASGERCGSMKDALCCF